MKRSGVAIILAVGAVAVGGAWHHFHASADPVQLVTSEVASGDIVKSVSCTGTLDAVTTVDVGSQVSGTIESIPVDFNSIVRKGEVLARLDTSIFKAQLLQAQANLAKAKADVGVAQAAVTDATEKLNRSKALAARQLIPQSDLDSARVAEDEAVANLKSVQAAQAQAQAAVDQADVSLEHTIILSPIDGIVVARKVDVGQTVAASFQTPSLFSIAADLTKMRVTATVDESDVGNVQVGQVARFTVDAYPSQPFEGKVVQVRLQPQTVQNVVTYDTVINVDNSQLLLKPGMTATVAIEVARREDVARIPTGALRFRPSEAVLTALGETTLVPKALAHRSAMPNQGGTGEVWVDRQGRIEPVSVRVGLSDGQSVEVLNGLPLGARVVTSAMLAVNRPTGSSASPLAPRPMYWHH